MKPEYLLIAVGVVAFLLPLLVDMWGSYKAAAEARQRIAQAHTERQKETGQEAPVWDLARATLDAYFQSNIGQIKGIFWLSVGVMAVGFLIVVLGVWNVIPVAHQGAPKTAEATSPAPATISVIAGVITEFIGATFLFIYKSTIQQASSYAQTLERINTIEMAMQILSTMPDEVKPDDLKSKTKAVLVETLVRQGKSQNAPTTEGKEDKQETTSEKKPNEQPA